MLASGQACTTPVQGFTQDAMGAPRAEAEGVLVDWPLGEEPAPVYCYLCLRGRSGLLLTLLGVGAAVVEPVEGAVGDVAADRDATRRAVEAAHCARFAAQTSS